MKIIIETLDIFLSQITFDVFLEGMKASEL